MSSLVLGVLCCLPLLLAALVAALLLAVRGERARRPPLRGGAGYRPAETTPGHVEPPSPSGPGHQLP
ncbi:hypothetical protein [Janibacter sp. YB324]|uniref:hypothetical protein n=1 Tax=Janibacter sp. YB324 TaxID=2761047 RepID=UPI0016276DDB|nr:hypothetical protein [Janibacter sp. YB324]QNF95540.1 hypothetical protein H7A72_07295 [Janibacter sp. YB324]